ncbi:Retrovirus-related Pol polyprotein from transposon TNT 1-94 [Cucumis melo var. makuwa]|uniref:Retrovirus-related Pol polyprotein from transposon TNT 1-94 n=1 Tax=Cucumis melo var. makuwa TaxID=1194695 RepID=A0A5D3E3P9_CUCMM|nr:Retrovirus-related Pol polyprotein from transposon TNT 1-94 [Cucumis melo var. makuwa]TYK30697.1 Retrovirus-related Pol polyprotein from transposon TNT 1-94 [Cucumis melo var. makuwa]
MDGGVMVSFIYGVVYLAGTVSFGIPRLIRASSGITRLICVSSRITKLICVSSGITRLIYASFRITRLICVSLRITRLIDSESADKSLAGTLISTLTNIKFDGSCTIHEHILEMTNLAARLKTMGMEVNENVLVTFILNSLSSEYGPVHMNYNTLKDKWNVHELQSMLIQEEARLKKPVIHFANLMGHKGAGKKLGKKNGNDIHGQL